LGLLTPRAAPPSLPSLDSLPSPSVGVPHLHRRSSSPIRSPARRWSHARRSIPASLGLSASLPASLPPSPAAGVTPRSLARQQQRQCSTLQFVQLQPPSFQFGSPHSTASLLIFSCLLKFIEGKGCVFTYDAVGSYERVGYSAQGSGATLITPFLDNQLKSPSPLLLPAKDAVTPLSEVEAIDLVKTCFVSATERDIYTGDEVEMLVVNASGLRREFMDLRKD
ncbi:uncharacterized protein LOC131022872, partial [Salvia miltiorrhiza]|uniref:uncharacterized protein LOC131022872 n=1 Tax=Salvia miltiorrhiza TaxID=226208 RepID=UPI0025AC4F9A